MKLFRGRFVVSPIKIRQIPAFLPYEFRVHWIFETPYQQKLFAKIFFQKNMKISRKKLFLKIFSKKKNLKKKKIFFENLKKKFFKKKKFSKI